MSIPKRPFDPFMKIDRPHPPWGPHVDAITPIPGIGSHKVRIGPDGNILSDEIVPSKKIK